mmetsp:Transcript_51789/g.117842  ORF Transcript_51789/g.117842 Transcript_51789/m.117842 type:complete len:209 (-) Transcript_51789:110-736(-)
MPAWFNNLPTSNPGAFPRSCVAELLFADTIQTLVAPFSVLANGSRTVAVCPPQNKARESVVGLLTRGLRDSPVWRTNSASRAGASHIGPLARRASRPHYCLPMAVGKLRKFTAVGLHAPPSVASELRGNCTTPAKKKHSKETSLRGRPLAAGGTVTRPQETVGSSSCAPRPGAAAVMRSRQTTHDGGPATNPDSQQDHLLLRRNLQHC